MSIYWTRSGAFVFGQQEQCPVLPYVGGPLLLGDASLVPLNIQRSYPSYTMDTNETLKHMMGRLTRLLVVEFSEHISTYSPYL